MQLTMASGANSLRRAFTAGLLFGALTVEAALTKRAKCVPRDPFKPIDPQNWVNPDNMTWDDFKSPPGTNWADPTRRGSVRNFNIALVVVDYPDMPFVITQAAHSTVFGNPQNSANSLARNDVPAFYRDLLNKPIALNHEHTIHEYWMEDSGGRYGVDLTVFGAYRMPSKSYQYGIDTGGFNPGACPAGERCSVDLRTDAIAAWRADASSGNISSYELLFILSAGQDESSTWQEFGEMKFQTKEDVPDAFGPPVGNGTNYAKTRYVEWTSWAAASTIWPNAGSGSSTQGESSGMGTYAHECTHLLGIGDNYNNPFGTPMQRDYTGPFSMMSRGSFNGPGGPHTRWNIPSVQGGSMGSLHTVRDKVKIGLVDKAAVLQLSREGLATQGIAVADLIARSVEPGSGLMGINISMSADLSPPCNVSQNALCDSGGYNNYNLEVIDRMGADSFQPDHGVMITKTRNTDRQPYQWTIDANPQDLRLIDFYRPDGTPAYITIGDYRQLVDALFHAGTNSNSEFEYIDTPNRLHFYIISKHHSTTGVLSYTVAVKSLDSTAVGGVHGVAIGPGTVAGSSSPTELGVSCLFSLKNPGSATPGAGQYFQSDVYRLNATVSGEGWRVGVPNALAAVGYGGQASVRVAVGAAAGASAEGVVELTAVSESDPNVAATAECRVKKG